MIIFRPFFLFVVTAVFLVFGPALLEGPISKIKKTDLFVWHEKITVLNKEKSIPGQIAYIGDSQIMGAILPERIRKLTGLEGVNLGLPAMQPEGMEAIVEKVLHVMPGLKIVVLGTGPYTLLRNDNYGSFLDYYRREMLYTMPGPALLEDGELELVGRNGGEFIRSLALLFPAYRMNEIVGPFVGFNDPDIGLPHAWIMRDPRLAGFERLSSIVKSGNHPVRRIKIRRNFNEQVKNIMAQNGGYWTWMSLDTPADPPCKDREDFPDIPVKPDFRYRAGAVNSYSRMIRKLQTAGIVVILAEVPLSPEWGKMVGREIIPMKDITIREIVKNSPGTSLFQISEGFGEAAFYDYTHLSGCGAAIYSDKLSRFFINNYPNGN